MVQPDASRSGERGWVVDSLKEAIRQGAMGVAVTGMLEGRRRTLAYEMVDYYDSAARMTSMMRTTSFPTSIIAQMAVNGTITARGVAPPEQCVPLDPFIAELKKRKIISDGN